jgi:hypothetical protein
MAEAGAALIEAVVVYALPARAYWFKVRVAAGTTIGDAIHSCGIFSVLPELAGRPLEAGVFGRGCRLEDSIRDGDRIEIYRPLVVDPKLARQRRAELKDG